MSDSSSHKLLLIGWDAADWKIALPLVKEGKMPHLKALMEQGSYGPIQTLDPPLSPMLWTSIATGKTADHHGILGFVEPDPERAQVRPASITSRRCKAIWNILNQHGKKVSVIGWWPSHPAEPLNGVMVSNMFGKADSKYTVFPDSIHPTSLEPQLMACKVDASDITLDQLLPFVPNAAHVDQQKDKHLHNLAALLANCNTIANLGKWVLQNESPDFTAVYFDVIDQVCHTFMKFFPPQMQGVPDEYFHLYQDVIRQMYIHHDTILGELIELAGKDTAVLLLSDHGFLNDHQRPVRLPNDPASPALEHSAFGICCFNGPGIRKDHPIHAAGLLDIAPTILNYFGIPVGQDMQGNILSEIFVDHRTSPAIPSWETVPGEDGAHPFSSKQNSWHSTEAMFQMMELGYIEQMQADQEKVLKKVLNESSYYLSRVLISQGKCLEAESVLKELFQHEYSAYRYCITYAAVLQMNGKQSEAREVVLEMFRKYPREIQSVELIEALLMDGEGKSNEAKHLLESMLKRIHHVPQLHIYLGKILLRQEEFLPAFHQFEKALAINDQSVEALQGYCFAAEMMGFEYGPALNQLQRLSKELRPTLINTLYKVNELDVDPDQRIDFRKYQLIIRLFLEQFHKGVQPIR